MKYKIHIITVCVDYISYFKDIFKHNSYLISNDFTIITAGNDLETQEFCKTNSINFYITDIFYKDNAKFNKGAALNEYFYYLWTNNKISTSDWFLLLDSDIIIDNNIDLYTIINLAENYEKTLYSASRDIYQSYENYLLHNKLSHEKCQGFGFFQLFHCSSIIDLLLYNNHQIFYENADASKYDIVFAYYNFNHIVCCGTVAHIGDIGQNWEGIAKNKKGIK